MARLLRAWWWTIACVGAATYIAALPAAFEEIRAGDRAQFVAPDEFGAALEESGWDPSVAAVVILALLVTHTVAAVGAATIVLRSCAQVPEAILISSILLALGLTWPQVGDALGGQWPVLETVLTVIAVYGLVGFLCLGFVFPDGRFVPGWTRWVVLLLALDLGLASFGVPVPTVVDLLVGGAAALSLAYSVVFRYRRVSDEAQRRQTRSVGVVLVAVVTAFVAVGLADSAVPDSAAGIVVAELAATTVYTLGFAVVPVTIAVAVMRAELWGAQRVLRRVLVIMASTAILLLAYCAVVIGSAAAVDEVAGPAATALGALAVALLLTPVRRAVTSWASRMLLGDRQDAGAAVVRLARRLDAAASAEEALRAVLSAVREAVRAPGAEVTGGDVHALNGSVPGPDAWEQPLVHQGETIGRLRVARRPGGDEFDDTDRKLLREVARPVAVAVHGLLQQSAAARLAVNLQASRERLVLAREEERRRLRRDLHDELGPILAGQVLRLEAAERLLDRDPEEARTLVRRGAEEAAAALEEVRRVVDGLRPPILDDAGLEGAVRSRAAELGGHVVVRPPPTPLPKLPAAVEVAAFHIASEAMVNAVRHADGATCWVRFSLRDDALVVVVEDDGPGLPDRPGTEPGDAARCGRVGAGLATMAERAAEVGGRLTCRNRVTGGVRVTAILPLGVGTVPS